MDLLFHIDWMERRRGYILLTQGAIKEIDRRLSNQMHAYSAHLGDEMCLRNLGMFEYILKFDIKMFKSSERKALSSSSQNLEKKMTKLSGAHILMYIITFHNCFAG